MLSIEGLKVAYGHVEALRGIDMTMKQGEITAIIGSNGAGKTSALMAISGLAPVTAGDIRFEGQTITRRRPHDITRLGITHILEGRQLFADQTVEDNLLLGGYTRLPRERARVAALMEREMARFPILHKRRRQLADGFDAAVNLAQRRLAPGDIEGVEFAIKDQPAEWQMVMNPPCKFAPIHAAVALVDQPGQHDAGHRSPRAPLVRAIPDMVATRLVVRGAIEAAIAADLVELF